MARMIDADVAIKRFRGWLEGPHEATVYNSGFDDAIWRVLDVIEHMPTLTPPSEDNNVPTKAPNDPLTLEVLAKSQLLQMLGEKVEVIRMGEMCQAEWATVRSFGDCKTDSGRLCCHELYGKTWIAYRRPPEEEI